MLIELSLVQNKRYKKSSFFQKLQLITVLLLICNSYMNERIRLATLKAFVEFSIFDSVSFSLKFSFLFNIKLWRCFMLGDALEPFSKKVRHFVLTNLPKMYKMGPKTEEKKPF